MGKRKEKSGEDEEGRGEGTGERKRRERKGKKGLIRRTMRYKERKDFVFCLSRAEF